MNKPPAFQFYAKDWIADTRELGPFGRGVLIDLIAFCWENGHVPDNPTGVSTVVGTTVEQVEAVWPMLVLKFTTEGAPVGRMLNRRLEAERAKQLAYRTQQSAKGIASGESRRRNSGMNNGSTGVEPKHEPNTNSASASASAKERDLRSPTACAPPPKQPPLPFRAAAALAYIGEASKGRAIPPKRLAGGKAIALEKTIRDYPDAASWRTFGAWLGAGGEAWRGQIAPGTVISLAGELMETALAWDREGRPAIGTGKATRDDPKRPHLPAFEGYE